MKKIVSLLILFAFLLFAGVASAANVWSNVYNSTGVSNIAVKVVKTIPMESGYNMIVATFDPVVDIKGSGCTVQGGTTSFQVQKGDWFYTNGGVTLNPSQFKMNEVLTYWFTDNPNLTADNGNSGTSPAYVYTWTQNRGSGNTAWAVKAYQAGTTVNPITEVCPTSGGSIYVAAGVIFPRFDATRDMITGTTVTSSTTFYAVHQLGWSAGISQYIVVIGK